MAVKEKRKNVRRDESIQIDFIVQGRIHHGTIKNKSKGGILIEALGSFSVGQVISVEYSIHSFGKINKTGTITRVEPKRIAVNFRKSGYSE